MWWVEKRSLMCTCQLAASMGAKKDMQPSRPTLFYTHNVIDQKFTLPHEWSRKLEDVMSIMLDQLLNRELWWTGTDLSVVTVLHVGKIWQGHCFWEGKGTSLLLSLLSWSVLLTVSSIGRFWNLDFFRYYLHHSSVSPGRWICFKWLHWSIIF